MGIFHESRINTIGKDLVNLRNPQVFGGMGKIHSARWHLSIDPYYNYGRPGSKYEGLGRTTPLPARPLSREN